MPGPSWPLLLTIAAVIVGTATLMERNSVYTEGEVMQALYRLAVAGTAALVFMGFANRSVAAWLILICGGGLILWQANQTRRWGILHEEVTGIVAYANKEKREKGRYPTGLGAYVFQHPALSKRIGYGFHNGKLYVSYYLNDPGISYWYHEDGGFGYYPD